ncbi:MAG: hypothetical protein QSU88_08750, partial [Candidatus Methanoperedens sp.]|nr:hypothetical protein [Candidatus Methanoperedens sp.]
MSAALSTPPNGFGHCPNPPASGRRTYCRRLGDSPAQDARTVAVYVISHAVPFHKEDAQNNYPPFVHTKRNPSSALYQMRCAQGL